MNKLDRIWNEAVVAYFIAAFPSTSQVRATALLLLLFKDIKTYGFGMAFNDKTFVTNFVKIYASILGLKHADRGRERRTL
jgi:hypothetical protein